MNAVDYEEELHDKRTFARRVVGLAPSQKELDDAYAAAKASEM